MSAVGTPLPPATVARAVVFDLGGVLIDWNPRYLYDRLIPDAAACEKFLTTVCSPEWNAGQDQGRPWQEAIAERSALFPDQAELIAAYFTRWEEMIPRAIPGTPEILATLQQKGIRTWSITNFSTETLPRACARFPFLRSFDGMIVSGEVGLLKPDPAIYRCLLQRFSLNPEELLFVDDIPANVAAAQALGMHGHRFINAENLKITLQRHRLLP